MAADVLPIIECGDPVLRRPAEPVDPADLGTAGLRRLVERMRATMEAAPGVGVAAPQVGVALQLAVLADGPERWGQLTGGERAARERTALPFTVLVNPVLEPAGGEDLVSFYEGCLSVPGLTAVVARHRAVRVRALDEHGQPVDASCRAGRPASPSTRPTTSAGASTWTGPRPGRCPPPAPTPGGGPAARRPRRPPRSGSGCPDAGRARGGGGATAGGSRNPAGTGSVAGAARFSGRPPGNILRTWHPA